MNWRLVSLARIEPLASGTGTFRSSLAANERRLRQQAHRSNRVDHAKDGSKLLAPGRLYAREEPHVSRQERRPMGHSVSATLEGRSRGSTCVSTVSSIVSTSIDAKDIPDSRAPGEVPICPQ
jgi:hypothetical protein